MREINDQNTAWQRRIVVRIVQILITATLLGLFLFFTQPDTLPIIGLLVPFVLLYTLIFQILLFVVRRSAPKATPKQLSLAAIISALPVIMLVLSSLNQLSGIDIVVVLFFAIGIYVYLQYFNLSPKQ